MRGGKLRGAYNPFCDNGIVKIRIHPAFIAAALLFIFTGNAVAFCAYTVAIIAHEIAHSRMAALRGYRMGSITLMPYGGVINGGERYARADNILIALAGPLFNAAVALLIVALWWLYPSLYSYTLDFCVANVALCVINLLPLYPLDGSRVVYSLAKNRLRALKVLRALGIAGGALLIAYNIISVFYTYNLTAGMMGVFLIYGAVFGTGEESYAHVTERSPLTKDFGEGVEKRTMYVDENIPLLKLLPMVRRDALTQFIVLDSDGRQRGAFDEEKLKNLCVDNPLTTPVYEALGMSKACKIAHKE